VTSKEALLDTAGRAKKLRDAVQIVIQQRIGAAD
jgi:hypothetical protein